MLAPPPLPRGVHGLGTQTPSNVKHTVINLQELSNVYRCHTFLSPLGHLSLIKCVADNLNNSERVFCVIWMKEKVSGTLQKATVDNL